MFIASYYCYLHYRTSPPIKTSLTSKTWELRFLSNPVEILSSDSGTVRGIKLEKNQLTVSTIIMYMCAYVSTVCYRHLLIYVHECFINPSVGGGLYCSQFGCQETNG